MISETEISIIIPAFNESSVIGDVVKKISSVLNGSYQYEIVVIDDGSHDNTADEAARAGTSVIRHPYNNGNGAAIKTGMMCGF
ncbi:MAG: hypothetical protein CSB33_02120 [Desulfobacterales bacterium]|nr:MAG: hypothetical protein CSB33_02120 [Desulfobacterales bacterium]